MTRRARGDGGLHWDEHRQRWIAATTIGYDGRGKRVVRKASGRTRTEAKNKLRDLLRDQADGLTAGVTGYTVRHAVEDWLAHGLGRQSSATVTKYRHLCWRHGGLGRPTSLRVVSRPDGPQAELTAADESALA